MSKQNIHVLQGVHAGATAYVLASGASMDFFPEGYFRDKLTIGVNQVHRKFPCQYVVSHHGYGCQEVIDKGIILVAAEYDCGEKKRGLNEFDGNYYYYCHAENKQTADIDLSALDRTDALAISASTVADAIHFAAHLGCTTIKLCGADHGRLDGKMNFDGYNGGVTGQTQPEHLPLTEPLILRLVEELRKRGRAVLSESPFINFGLEGHRYSRPPAGVVFIRATEQTPGQPDREVMVPSSMVTGTPVVQS